MTHVPHSNAIMAAVPEDGRRSWSARRELFRREGMRCTPYGFDRTEDAIHCLVVFTANPSASRDAAAGTRWNSPPSSCTD